MQVIQMDVTIDNPAWDAMSHQEKNHQLFLRQKEILEQFLARGAISKAQHDRSLSEMRIKMGETL